MSEKIKWIVRTSLRTWLFFGIHFAFIAVVGAVCFGILCLTGLDTELNVAISAGAGIAAMWIASSVIAGKQRERSRPNKVQEDTR